MNQIKKDCKNYAPKLCKKCIGKDCLAWEEKTVAKYIGETGIDEGFHYIYRVNKEDVYIYPPARDPMEGYRLPWRVVWCGGLDFEGNKKELLERYPEFKGQL